MTITVFHCVSHAAVVDRTTATTAGTTGASLKGKNDFTLDSDPVSFWLLCHVTVGSVTTELLLRPSHLISDELAFRRWLYQQDKNFIYLSIPYDFCVLTNFKTTRTHL